MDARPPPRLVPPSALPRVFLLHHLHRRAEKLLAEAVLAVLDVPIEVKNRHLGEESSGFQDDGSRTWFRSAPARESVACLEPASGARISHQYFRVTVPLAMPQGCAAPLPGPRGVVRPIAGLDDELQAQDKEFWWNELPHSGQSARLAVRQRTEVGQGALTSRGVDDSQLHLNCRKRPRKADKVLEHVSIHYALLVVPAPERDEYRAVSLPCDVQASAFAAGAYAPILAPQNVDGLASDVQAVPFQPVPHSGARLLGY